MIIFSVLIALGLDRCNQNWQDQKKLNEYMTLIYQELVDERRQNENNIADCGRDVSAIELAMETLNNTEDAVLETGLMSCMTVLGRGVFRTFPPLTYDRMVASGEANLIKSIQIKDRLSAYGAFRNNYLQYDLKEFDKSTLDVLEKFSPYLDLNCTIRNRQGPVLPCVKDKKSIRQVGTGSLGRLYRLSTLRLFHLERGQALLDYTIEVVEDEIGKLEK